MTTHNLIGKQVAFVPCFLYKKSFHDSNADIKPVRATITFVHPRHGWFRAEYPAGRTKQYECFKLADIGGDVTLIGRR